MRIQSTRFAYAMVNLREGNNQTVPHAELTCVGCGDKTTKRMLKPHLPPEVVGKWFQRQGWELDPMKPQSVRCPACQKQPKAVLKLIKETDVTIANTKPAALSVVPQAKPADPPKLTPEQKILVRRKLDASFDEPKGVYLDGYTDQRIGEEIGLPWLAVRELREAAYGPLRSVPELDALLAQQTALKSRADEAITVALDISKAVQDLAASIAKMSAKFGIRAE